MKGYESYKNSGVDWIGKIPNQWCVLNFRYILNILTDFTANGSFGDLAKNVSYLQKGYSRLIRLTDLRENLSNEGIYVSEESHTFLGKSALYGNEMLLANVGAYAGLAWKVPELNGPSTLGPNMFLLKFNDKVLNNFVYYALVSDYLLSQLKNKATSSAQPKLNKEDVRSTLFILPSIEEQIKIISFLDYKTNLIDATIEKKKHLIALLKEKRQAVINEAVTKGLNPNAPMKKSGVEWLGEIPEHWAAIKLKHIASTSFSSVDRHEYTEEIKVSICHYPDAYKNDKINSQTSLSTGTCTESEFEKFQLKKGQVIITKDSESANDIGVPTYIDETLENAVCGYHLAILEPQEGKLNGEFLFRFIQTSNVAIYFENNSNGVTRFGLGKPKIENLFVILPSLEEQSIIIEHINYQSELIDKSISKIKMVIEKLQTYRQSLISEAVTGKIDIRDWQPTKNK
jgi:type I restriction enzyme S subunit